MKNTYSIAKAQSNLPGLVRESENNGTIAITRHDETVAYVVSRERMDAIMETMDILGNSRAMRAVREYERGKTRFHPVGDLDNAG